MHKVADMKIRRARPEEAEALSGLAMRSKAYWGYDRNFMNGCREELTLTPEELKESITYVLDGADEVTGFYRLTQEGKAGELLDLFLEPALIGHGYGRMLWHHLVEAAKMASITSIRLDADPHAEGFYKKMGCRTIGSTPSRSFPGRTLPLMVYDIPTR